MILRRIVLWLAALALVVAGLSITGPAQALGCDNPWVDKYPSASSGDNKYYGEYFLNTGTWNAADYNVTQVMRGCNYNDWNVTANMDNSTGDGAVKTYPHVARLYGEWGNRASQPKVSSFATIESTFASTSPDGGIYDAAYDLWLNDGNIEVMIWNRNSNQTPAGSIRGQVTQDGHTYDVWKSGRDYYAFVPRDNFDSGTIDLKGKIDYMKSRGWVGDRVKLTQIEYGIEFVSTGNVDKTFTVTDYSVHTVKN